MNTHRTIATQSSSIEKPSWLRRYPLHPFLFAVYPILALLAINISEVQPSSGLRALLLSVVTAGLLTLAFFGIFRNWKRAALLTTVVLILFYSYGHIYILLKSVEINGFYLFRHRTLVPLWIALGLFLVWWFSRKSFRTGCSC
jgi:hypothetical protein